MAHAALDHFLEFLRTYGPILGPLAAALLAVLQMRAMQRQRADEALKERRRRTLALDARIARFAPQRALIEKTFSPAHWQQAVPLAEIDRACKAHPRFERALNQMLTAFQILAIPVCSQTADEEMAWQLIGQSLVWYATAFREYIAERNRRECRADLYDYLCYLAARWKDRPYRRVYSLG